MLANGLNMFTFKEVLGKYHHLVTCYNNSNQDKCVEMSDILTKKKVSHHRGHASYI